MLHLSGLRVGKLTVTDSFIRKNRYIYWICNCDCGGQSEVRSSHLKKGAVRSCGCETCIKEETHGLSRSHPLYGVWLGIKTRCFNPKSYAYRDYGKRGITICDEWKDDFVRFFKDMEPTYQPGLTIERKDVNGNYCKENCIWATMADQAKNRRSTIWIDTIEGFMTVQDAAKRVGISWVGMYQRVKTWPKEKLLLPRIK